MKTILVVLLLACAFASGMLLENHLQGQPTAVEGVAACSAAAEGGNQDELLRSRAEGIRTFFSFLSSSSSSSSVNAGPLLEDGPPLALDEARKLFEEALANRRVDIRAELLSKVALEVAPDLIPRVIGWAERIPGSRDRENFVTHLLGRWAAEDAPAALAYAENIQAGPQRFNALDTVLRRWQSSDPDAAISWMLARPPSGERQRLLSSSLTELIYTDPERAFALYSHMRSDGPNTAGPEYLVAPMFMRLAEKDPAAAAQKALTLSRTDERLQALQTVASAWGHQEPEAALAWVDSLPAGTQRDAAWAAVLLADAERDPETAMKRLASRADHPEAEALTFSLASTWASQDPEGALMWAKRLPAGSQRDSILRVVGQHVAGDDPRRAFQLAQEVGDQETQKMLLRESVREWALQDPQEAVRNIFTLAPSEARTQILADMVGGWTGSDPGAAAEFVERLPPGEERDQAAIQLLVGLGYQDPRKAADYLGRFPGKVTDEVVGAVVGSWADQSLEEVTAWVVSLPSGSTQDKAREVLSGVSFDRDPESAIEQVRAIQDEEVRNRAAMNLMSRAEAVGDETTQELLRQSFPLPVASIPGETFTWGGCTCTCPAAPGAIAEPGIGDGPAASEVEF